MVTAVIVVLLVLVVLIFQIKNGIAEPLIDGLHSSFVGLDKATIDRMITVRDQIPVAEVRSFVKELANEISYRLEQGQDMGLGIILTEEGLAAKEVAIGADSAEVFGIVETDEGVIAGAAVVTAEGAAYEIGVATEEGEVVETGVVTPEGEVIVDEVFTDEVEKKDEEDE